MKRRCYFLDNLPAYNYNAGVAELVTNTKGRKVHTNTQHLGSTLMRAFLREAEEFCHPKAQANWSTNPHQQVMTIRLYMYIMYVQTHTYTVYIHVYFNVIYFYMCTLDSDGFIFPKIFCFSNSLWYSNTVLCL